MLEKRDKFYTFSITLLEVPWVTACPFIGSAVCHGVSQHVHGTLTRHHLPLKTAGH